jgi:NAD(P)-dependent dehydrogenase (short-subunit alcohol dehydrogenase family)
VNDLHSKGWKVAIVDMNASEGEEAVSKLGKDSAIFIKADVSKWEENVNFFKVVKQKFGRIDFGTDLASILMM